MQAKVFQESATGHRGNIGTDLPGTFLTPQEAPGGQTYRCLVFREMGGGGLQTPGAYGPYGLFFWPYGLHLEASSCS